jgi:hypothetical protein
MYRQAFRPFFIKTVLILNLLKRGSLINSIKYHSKNDKK